MEKIPQLHTQQTPGTGTTYPRSTLLTPCSTGTLSLEEYMERADLEQWKSREVARLLALVETERRYWQEIVSTLPVALAVLTPQRYIISANRTFRAAFGLRPEDLRTRTVDDVLAGLPELPGLISETLSTASSLSAPRQTTARLDGRRIRVSLLPHRDWDDDNRLAVLIAIENLDDVSAPVLVPSPLPPSPPPPAPVPLGIPAVAWTYSRKAQSFSYLSESIARFVFPAPAPSKPSDWPFHERIAELDREAVKAHYEHILRYGVPDSVYSCEFRMADMSTRWYRETVRVEADALHGILTEITERKTLEEHQMQSQRIDALALIAGRIAHDLNNPLMIVGGYCEEIQESFSQSDSRRKDMQQVLDAADRIGDLAASLQAFSRKPARLDPTATVDLRAELDTAVERMKEAAGSGLTVEYTPPAGRLPVVADSRGLQSLVFEVTAALSDTPTVHVGIRARGMAIQDMAFPNTPNLAPGMAAVLVIENKGPRLVNARRSPLFESPLPGKEASDDSGNTLARAFRHVEAWGGSIWVSPDQHTVRILLRAEPETPVEVQGEIPQRIEIVPPPAPTPQMPDPSPLVIAKRILVVDDETGIRSLMRKILAREGYDVADAGDAAEAMQCIEEKPFDLLLTDVVMPGVNGRELAEQVLALRPEIKVLYVSGYTGETAVESGEYPPGSMLLQKPFTLGALLRKVKEILD